MKQSLQLKASQNLALTPQLQQSIRLLQLSSLELNQELEGILLDNPLLEIVDENEDNEILPNEQEAPKEAADNADAADNTDAQASSELDLQEAPSEQPKETTEEAPIANEEFNQDAFDEQYDEYGSASNWDESKRPNNSDDDSDYVREEVASADLRSHLLEQLKLMPLSDRDQKLILLIIDSINEDGYLEESLEELAEMLPEELEVELVELETVMKLIHSLDPPGIGAANLQDCILLQLNILPEDTPHLDLAKAIVQDHLLMLANKDFTKLRKALSCNEEELKAAQTLIKEQNPRPGADFAQFSAGHFIQHEVVVKKVKGIWVATLNDGVIPRLRINQMYVDILKDSKGGSENSGEYLQSQMQEARWMIKNIQQRFSTILRVSQAIIDRQRNFFEYGEIAMRPLVLREIAEELELHESTISRVTTHKYMLTPRGVFELKYFFGSHVATDAGGECSATAIRALIKQLVAEENVKKPHSDNQISELLSKQGIVVARRTIAKYRESLNIPPANLRKSL